MADAHHPAGAATPYDGVLRRPFLAEHWYKGIVAAGLSFCILTWLLGALLDDLPDAAVLAGAVSLLSLAAVVTHHQRFELDPGQRRYRSCLWVLGLRFGSWQPVSAIEAVKLRHRAERHFLPVDEARRSATGLTAVEDKWQVLLHVQGSPVSIPVSIVAAYVPKAHAAAAAVRLAALLQVALLGGPE